MVNQLLLTSLISLTFASIIGYIATIWVKMLYNKAGLVDDPSKQKHPKVIHAYPVPRGGGLSTFLAIFLAAVIFLPVDKHLVGILVGAAIVTIVGVADDKFNLNPYLRIAAGFLAASAPIIAGIGIAFITNPFNGVVDLSQPQINFFLLGETRSIWILSDIFALIWIVFMMNMLNMGAKGVDGQLPGVVVVACIAVALLSLKFSADITQWPIIILAAITAGAYLGFLPWNFYPQKIMPGYSGSTLAGYMLAIISILSTTKVGVLIVSLGIPLVDTGYVIIRRLMSGKSPVWGDRGHLHHRLLDAGMSKKQVSLFYWTATAILGGIALNLNTSFKLYTILGVAAFVGGLIIWLTYRSKLSK